MSKGHAAVKFLRKVHLILEFLLPVGCFSLRSPGHCRPSTCMRRRRGSNYMPPAWIASLAQLHKKQTTAVSPRKPRPAGPENAPGEQQRGDAGSRVAASSPADAVRTAPSEVAGPAQAQPGPSRLPKAGEASSPSAPRKSHLPMKTFFLLVSLSLVTSTLTGICLSYKYSRGWWVLTGLLVAGVAVPLLLLPF